MYFYDPEDRQRQQDAALYKSLQKPKVSDAEACSAAKVFDLSEPLTSRGLDDEDDDMKDMHGQDS